MPSIMYRAACPGCGDDVWWHGTPVTTFDEHRAHIAVKCPKCDAAEHAERALKTAELVA